jgi:hypothetical protein
MGINIGIGNLRISSGSRGGNTLPDSLLAKFLFLWNGKYSGDNLLSNLDSSVITVTGRDWTGSVIPDDSAATFSIPQNSTYSTADEDGFWGSSVTFADLIASTTQRTFIKYTDFEPYSISAIGILKSGEVLTDAERVILNRYFKLWVQYWGDVMMDSGYMKDNRILI